jgi:hypothetical protein
MNLQTIQKRVEELTSELLTISNDLSFLLHGEVVRDRVGTTYIRSRHELRVGDVINIPEGNLDDYNVAGTYTVREIEPSSYEGVLSVRAADSTGANLWIQFERLAGVTKGA